MIPRGGGAAPALRFFVGLLLFKGLLLNLILDKHRRNSISFRHLTRFKRQDPVDLEAFVFILSDINSCAFTS